MNPGGDPLAGIVVTAREIYDAVVRLTGRVDVIIAQSQTLKEDVDDHEARIRSLEKSRWPLPSLSVVISLVAVGVVVFRDVISG